jgi:uncharacterized protein
MTVVAESHITTDMASKYLKWLCGHFKIKTKTEYDDSQGTVEFAFGTCQMQAQADALHIRVEAPDEESFSRIKYVVADHLERFARKEAIHVTWVEENQ